MPRAVLTVLALAALLGGAYLLYAYRTGESANNLSATSAPSLSVSTKTIDEETERYLLHVKYPHFGSAAIDRAIDARIMQDVDVFKSEARAIDFVPTGMYEMSSTFDTVTTSADVASARLVLSQYTGGAHPNATVIGLNFDPKSGSAYTLADALRMTGMSLQALATEAKRQLKAAYGEAIQFPEGADPTAENYSAFVIGEKEVTFYFQPYQVAAYAAGILDVSVSKK